MKQKIRPATNKTLTNLSGGWPSSVLKPKKIENFCFNFFDNRLKFSQLLKSKSLI